MTELQIQTALRARLRHIAPAVCLIAVPNGAERGQRALNRAMKEGLKIGFPDLVALSNQGDVAFIEVKAEKGRLSPNQEDWQARLKRWGFHAAVVRSADEGEAFLREAGFPFMVAANAA